MKSFSFAIVIIACFSSAYATKCYITEKDEVTEADCPTGSCMKKVSSHAGNNVATYTCSLMSQDDGCSSETQGGVEMETCYCNTELCNSSSGMILGLPLLLVTLLLKVVL